MNEEKLRELIKECGSYSGELDGYVVNPSTVACKILNAGYLPVEEVQLKTKEAFDLGVKHGTDTTFAVCLASPENAVFKYLEEKVAEAVEAEITKFEEVQLEVLKGSQITDAVEDYRRVLEMNGHKPTVADGRIAISQATVTHNSKTPLYRRKG